MAEMGAREVSKVSLASVATRLLFLARFPDSRSSLASRGLPSFLLWEGTKESRQLSLESGPKLEISQKA